jgi:hypothetical protein
VPGDGTNGVTIDAIATGDPDKSWTVIDQPFRSFEDWSLLDCTLFHDGYDSDIDELEHKFRSAEFLQLKLQLKTACLVFP